MGDWMPPNQAVDVRLAASRRRGDSAGERIAQGRRKVRVRIAIQGRSHRGDGAVRGIVVRPKAERNRVRQVGETEAATDYRLIIHAIGNSDTRREEQLVQILPIPGHALRHSPKQVRRRLDGRVQSQLTTG
jgi:hypothetical protein